MITLAKKILPLVIPERRILWRRSAADGALHLTFDDGPNPQHTPQVLDILDRFNAKGTFFLVAERTRGREDIVREIVGRGHAIGNHSYSHRMLPDLTINELPGEIDRAQGVLAEITGRAITMYRPPRGRMSATALRYLMRRRLQIVMWSIDSLDYHRDSSSDVLERMQSMEPGPGDIALFHDDNPFTVKALPVILGKMADSGLTSKPL
jgi:peptidoglycan/xylan/chitin deacetylase (PgdA/CDA1 family)